MPKIGFSGLSIKSRLQSSNSSRVADSNKGFFSKIGGALHAGVDHFRSSKSKAPANTHHAATQLERTSRSPSSEALEVRDLKLSRSKSMGHSPTDNTPLRGADNLHKGVESQLPENTRQPGTTKPEAPVPDASRPLDANMHPGPPPYPPSWTPPIEHQPLGPYANPVNGSMGMVGMGIAQQFGTMAFSQGLQTTAAIAQATQEARAVANQIIAGEKALQAQQNKIALEAVQMEARIS